MKTVLVIGAPSSGTSLTAALLHRAGIYMGRELSIPTSACPYGHFEDADFLDFHGVLLGNRRMNWETISPVDEISIEETLLLKSILDARPHEKSWGWKDIKTPFFAAAYLPLLKEPVAIHCRRKPRKALQSLCRANGWGNLRAATLILKYYDRSFEFCMREGLPWMAVDFEAWFNPDTAESQARLLEKFLDMDARIDLSFVDPTIADL